MIPRVGDFLVMNLAANHYGMIPIRNIQKRENDSKIYALVSSNFKTKQWTYQYY